jgi:uncharacterized RDD family membrane protein YckC
MPKQRPEKLITIFSFIIALACLFNDAFYSTHDLDVIRIKQSLDPLNLDWVFAGYSLLYNGYNFVNAFFDVLLLLGVLIFAGSNFKKSGLIRFIFSIIFFSNILSFPVIIAFLITKAGLSLFLAHLPASLFCYALYSFWIYISHKILRYLNQHKTLQTEIVSAGETSNSYFVRASKWQRFLHPLIDTIVTIAIFSPLLKFFVDYDSDGLSRYILQTHESRIQENMLLVILALRIVYYLFYEAVFGFTPAKLLTSTRTIDYDGNKPSFKKVFVRTVSRLVPFEAFSFFADDGWHDKWSETLVVEETIKKESSV